MMASLWNTVIEGNTLICKSCGARETVKMPSGIDEISEAHDRFGEQHSSCQYASHKEEVNLNALLNWLESGKHDNASLTMYSVLSGKSIINETEYACPENIASFSRCNAVLTAAPEWRRRLREMKRVSKQWAEVVSHWDKLTTLYNTYPSAASVFLNFLVWKHSNKKQPAHQNR